MVDLKPEGERGRERETKREREIQRGRERERESNRPVHPVQACSLYSISPLSISAPQFSLPFTCASVHTQ